MRGYPPHTLAPDPREPEFCLIPRPEPRRNAYTSHCPYCYGPHLDEDEFKRCRTFHTDGGV